MFGTKAYIEMHWLKGKGKVSRITTSIGRKKTCKENTWTSISIPFHTDFSFFFFYFCSPHLPSVILFFPLFLAKQKSWGSFTQLIWLEWWQKLGEEWLWTTGWTVICTILLQWVIQLCSQPHFTRLVSLFLSQYQTLRILFSLFLLLVERNILIYSSAN